MPAIRTGRYLGTHAPRPRVRTERHLESHALRPRQNRAAPRVPCPATQHQERTVPRIPPRTTTTIANCAADFPPESLRQSQSDAEPPPRGQSVVASQPPASRKSGVASQVNLADKTGRRRGLHPPLPHGQGRSAPRPRLTPRGQEANMPPRELSDKCAIIRERHSQPGARSGRRATAIRICHTESKARRIATRDAPEYNSPANSQIGNRIPSDNRNTRKGNLLGWILQRAGVMRADKHSD